MQHCWICGDPATTSEHKIKKSDLARVHGRGSAFVAANLNYKRSDDSVVILQGPDSKWLKWPNVLCAPCNNQKTQPFDRAYEDFIEYADANRRELMTTRQVDFSVVYGGVWRERQRDLFKYFTKALGCKIADVAESVPVDLSDLLFQEQFQTALWVCIAVNEDELQKSDSDQTLLRTGNLIFNGDRAEKPRYASAYFYRWLVFTFWYGWGPFGPVGGRWCADTQYLHLGSYSESQAAPNIGTCANPIHWPGF